VKLNFLFFAIISLKELKGGEGPDGKNKKKSA
jgi:hypothetical protein